MPGVSETEKKENVPQLEATMYGDRQDSHAKHSAPECQKGHGEVVPELPGARGDPTPHPQTSTRQRRS